MKKLFTFAAAILIATGAAFAQPPLPTSISENFNVDCITAGNIPGATGWYVYNAPLGLGTNGSWECTPTNGRPTSLGTPTPGMQCTDTFAGAYHLDTSFLITPLIDLSSYSSIFLQFDTRTSKIVLGATLTVEIAHTNTVNPDSVGATVLAESPVFGSDDSSRWITHVVDLTPYKSGAFYVAFRYTSSDTTGSIWFVDNVFTTPYNITLGTPALQKDVFGLKEIGISTGDELKFSYTAPAEGAYQLMLCDMVGREVYKGSVNAVAGTANQTITGINLRPGMYVLRMSNESGAGVTKVMVR